MAQPIRNSPRGTADTITEQMKELHVKLHKNLATSGVSSPLHGLDREKTPSDRSYWKVPVASGSMQDRLQTSHSIYTWNQKHQGESETLIADSVSSLKFKQIQPSQSCDTKWKSVGANMESFSESAHIPTLLRAEKQDPYSSDILKMHNPAQIYSPKVSTDNTSGLESSIASDKAVPWNSSPLLARPQDGQPLLNCNIQRAFSKAFKPIEPHPYNTPLAVDVAKPSGHMFSSTDVSNLCVRHSAEISRQNQSQPLKELCPNMMAYPAVGPASPLPATQNLARNLPPVDSSPVGPKRAFPIFPTSPKVSLLSPGMSMMNKSSSITSGSFSSASSSVSPSSCYGALLKHSPSSPVSGLASPAKHHLEVQSCSETPDTCTCNRLPSLVLCKACGETIPGRMRQICKVHPNQIFLMDVRCCPKCQSENLKEVGRKQE